MRRLSPWTLLVPTFLVVVPLTVQEQAGSLFIRAEYWTCPQENLEALAHATDSIWAPILDEMVSEGVFVDWGRATPLKASPVRRGQPGERSEIEPEWDWVFSFTATSKVAFHSAWEDFFGRLKGKFPDEPKPWLFCDGVVLVDYEAPGAATGDADLARIGEARAGLATALRSDDLPGILAELAEEHITMAPDVPALSNDEALAAWHQERIQGFKTAIQFTTEDIRLVGDYGIERWSSRMTLTPRAGGDEIESRGKGLWVWQREADGSWKLLWSIWNRDSQPLETGS